MSPSCAEPSKGPVETPVAEGPAFPSYTIRRWASENKAIEETITIDGVDLEHVATATLQAADGRLNLEVCVLETLQKRAAKDLGPIIASLGTNQPSDSPSDRLPDQSLERAKAKSNAQLKATDEYIAWRTLMHQRFLLVELQEDLQQELARRRTAFPWR